MHQSTRCSHNQRGKGGMLHLTHTLCICTLFDIFMSLVDRGNEEEALEAARGLKTRTSTKDLSDLPLQKPFIAMSSLAPSWMLAEEG